jgi:cytochrome c-type biogenesis protein CcmH
VSGWNTAAKGWPAWLGLLFVAVVLLIVGGVRDHGASTPEERAVAIERILACPECQGESVYESQAPVAVDIRNQIRRRVDEGRMTDDEIVGELEEIYGEPLLMRPKSGGINTLVWALPVAAAVAGGAGLVLVFRKWRRESAATADPTDADRELVAAALAREGVTARVAEPETDG